MLTQDSNMTHSHKIGQFKDVQKFKMYLIVFTGFWSFVDGGRRDGQWEYYREGDTSTAGKREGVGTT